MKLYEIDREIMACIDHETGEIIDTDKLSALQMEREEKIENVALWVKNLEAEAAAYKAEKEAFAKREQTAKSKVEYLKSWLTYALQGQKFSTTRAVVSFRTSEAVEVTDPESFRAWASKEADDLLTFAMPQPNKTAIKDAIRNGRLVPGAQIVKRQNLQIR